MTLKAYTFESQSDGVTVTSGNIVANGDPTPSALVISGTAAPPTMKYTTAHPVIGSVGIRVTAGVNDTCVIRTPTFAALNRQCAFQLPIYLEAPPTSAAVSLAQYRSSGGNQFSYNLDTALKMYLVDNAGANKIQGTVALPTATDLILDLWANVGAGTTDGAAKWQVRKKSDLSVVDSSSATNLNLNNTSAARDLLQSIQFAKPNGGGAITGLNIGGATWDDGATDYTPYAVAALDYTIAASPTTAPVPFTTTLTISGITGGTGTAVSFIIDWGDGTSETHTGVGSWAHTYSAARDYTISVSGSNT